MTLLPIALAMAFQTQQPQPQPAPPPLQAESPASRSLSPAHDLYFEDSAPLSTDARLAAQDFGACVADSSSLDARAVLSLDFASPAYDRGLRRLVSISESCARRRGSMRSGRLLVAGAIAERLIEREDEPLNLRLARAALRPATPDFSAADRAAICVVRSVPDEVSSLFAAEVAGDAESAVAESLEKVMTACSGDGQPIDATPATLRAILATAAFRELRTEAARIVPTSNPASEASQ